MGPRISVVTPNYNDAALLEQSIESVLAQTFPDWEMVIVDDGSTDDSPAIIERYARRDKRIRAERFAKNQGVIAAIRRGVELASGAYLYPKGSDIAIVNAQFFRRVVDGFTRYPDAAIAFGLTSGVDAQGKVAATWAAPTEPNEYVSPEQGVKEFFLSDYIAGESTVVEATRFRAHGMYDPALGPWADVLIHETLVALYGGIYIGEVITHSRLDPNSFSRRQTVRAMVEFAARMEKGFRALPLKVAPRREWIVQYRERKLAQALMFHEQQSLANTLGQIAANVGGWPANRRPNYLPALVAQLQSLSQVVREETQATTRAMLALYEEIAGPAPAG